MNKSVRPWRPVKKCERCTKLENGCEKAKEVQMKGCDNFDSILFQLMNKTKGAQS